MKGLFNGFNMGISMFTVIPPFKKVWDEDSGKFMMPVFPFIGLLIGVLWYAITIILIRFHFKGLLLTGIVLAIPFLLTGFLHLDGFMDVCDALLSRREREEKLRILKDSTIGAFSVISLVLLLIIQLGAINESLDSSKKILFFILVPIISRALVGYFLLSEEPIKESYFARLYKKGASKGFEYFLIFIFLVLIIISFFINIKFVFVPLIIGLCAKYLLYKCKKELGGINGDVAGYIIVLSEFIGLVVLAIA